MTEPLAAQEDQLVLPREWHARVLPRRGNGVRRPFELDGEAPLRMRERIDAERPYLLRSLDAADFEPGPAAAGHAYLAGEPNPLGAAVVSLLIRTTEWYDGAMPLRTERTVDVRREPFAAWTVEFGLTFAVAAAIEELGHDITGPWPQSAEHRLRHVQTGRGSRVAWQRWEQRRGPIELARGLIAEADADEYKRIVASAADHRTTPAHRMAAAYLLPDETDWVATACEETGTDRVSGACLPWSIVGDADHLERLGWRAIRPAQLKDWTVAEAAANLGAAAVPVLAATLKYKRLTTRQRAMVFEAIAMLLHDEAMAFLLDRNGDPQALSAVRAAVARFPVRAARTAASRADALPPLELARIGGILRAHPERFESALARLHRHERAALERFASDTPAPVAEPDRLPEILIAPPWANRRKSPAFKAVRGLEPPEAIAIAWEAAEHERAMAIEPQFHEWDENAYWSDISGDVANRVGLSLADGIWAQLARNGADAADAIVERLRKKPNYGRALVPIRSPKAAHLAVDWLARRTAARAHAVAWLDRHGEHGARLLIPVALEPGRRRRGGEVALRHLAETIGAEAVARAAAPYGPEAADRIASLLEAETLEPPFGFAPRPGAWADPDLLPPVALRDGNAVLPRPAVSHLIAVLSLCPPRLPYRGADAVAETCDAASLRRFSHALFELWLSAGAPAADAWAVDQLARFGTDETVALLEPRLASWPASHPDRTVLGLEVLAAIGTDAAFGALHRMSLMDNRPAIALVARDLAGRLAARHGVGIEQFADRAVPDHGIAEPETLRLDYGPRRFHLRFDELLRPHLADESGKPRARLPRPGVRDDQATAKASIERCKRLIKDVERTAGEQARRLQAAMFDGRTWSAAEFRRLAEHPIVAALARRLIWATGDGTGFRLAEDGGLADVHDRELELGEEATVRLAHPALLGGELPAWIELCNDYAVLQPFPQLARPAMAFTDEEAATGRLRRFEGATATMGALREAMRWQGPHRSPEDFGTRIWGFTREVPGGWLLADIDPVPDPHDPDPGGRHLLVSVRLAATRNRHPDHAAPLPGSRLDPVAASELLADLSGAILH